MTLRAWGGARWHAGSHVRAVVTAAFLLVWVVALRANSLHLAVIDWDESLYAVMAREWLAGGPLAQHYRLEAAFEDHTMWVPDTVELYRRVP